MSRTVPSSVKNPEKIRERRDQIIEAAVQLFREKGFHKTTTREIAKASGLSNGAVYEYVRSKEDILYLVCKRIHSSVEEQLRSRLSEHARGATRLKHAMEAFFGVVELMKNDILLIYQESKSLPREFLREVLRDEEAVTKVFERLLVEGNADGSLALAPESIPIMAQNIVVSGQMWAFRRWAFDGVAFEQFCSVQTAMLMQACGAVDA
ncbi:TetR/AcrR family transcriptional regulator [Alicyclobacillus fastidiosus]|uniref:TetR/AcrR family transcriptional regulator n=1 Tax=Alicyclobacillus fastidiosus TaxID=392011 RepID=A0ABV5AFN4_9BACL|nr:TetR/AcrR family transcriptional regulator [Alicyclobacillus fastidiosus]WEH09613.1 TetR/AcrR family transcriptional regulator [Alicyclobacillus fastidiosus]